jgi:hypothetical protein
MARSKPDYRPLRAEALSADSGTRRGFLRNSAVVLGGAAFTSALGGMFSKLRADDDTSPETVKTGELFFPRLKFHVRDRRLDIWNSGPSGDAILRRKLVELTNVNASREPVVVELEDLEKMSRYPYVFMTSESEFDLETRQANNLREFLMRGGFVHADDCVHPKGKDRQFKSDLGENFEFKDRERGTNGIDGDRFFMDYCRIINSLFPDNPMRRIPDNHEIYRSYFNFPKGCPVMQGVDHGAWGLFEKGTGRLMTVATPGDLHCGWMSLYFGAVRDLEAIKMGINVLMYYLTH